MRLRLTLLLFVVVFSTLAVSGAIILNGAVTPFVRRVAQTHRMLLEELALQLEAGAEPSELGPRFGVRVRVAERPPKRRHCRPHDGPGRPLLICRGRPGLAAVALEDGRWAILRRPFDPEAIRGRILVLLLAVASGLAVVCWWVAGRISQPLRLTVGAMERVASGDLTHRIESPRGLGLREAATAFNRMADRVDRIVRAERSLMAGISHELRTPLARLRLQTEMLRDGATPSGNRLDAMDADLVEVDRLIDELFTVSRLAWEDSERGHGMVDLNEVVTDALSQTPFQRVTPQVEGSGVRVWGHRRQLTRVVQNLLQNADKHADPGPVVIRHLEDGFEVVDSGPGVDPSALDRLFEPFYRGRSAQDRPGVGLGLMVVRQTMELHGGTAEASLQQGGLAIRCRFPAHGSRG